MQDQDSNTTGKVKVFLEDVLKIIDAEIAASKEAERSFASQENWHEAYISQAENIRLRIIRVDIAGMKGV